MSVAVHVVLHDELGRTTDEYIAGPFDNEVAADDWVEKYFVDIDDSPDHTISICPFLTPAAGVARGKPK